jgi:hypothetical protein
LTSSIFGLSDNFRIVIVTHIPSDGAVVLGPVRSNIFEVEHRDDDSQQDQTEEDLDADIASFSGSCFITS